MQVAVICRLWTAAATAKQEKDFDLKTTAKEIMTTPVISVRPDTKLDEVMGLLLQHQVSGMPVVDENDRLVGVITELDMLKLLFDTMQIEHGQVSDYLTSKVVTIDEEDSLIDVAEVFMHHTIRRVPIMRGDKVVGIISRRDVIRCIRDIRKLVTKEWRDSHAANAPL